VGWRALSIDPCVIHAIALIFRNEAGPLFRVQDIQPSLPGLKAGKRIVYRPSASGEIPVFGEETQWH
jgi:hypothetical protein